MLLLTRHFPAFYLYSNGLVYLLLAWLFASDGVSWFANLGIVLNDAGGYTELRATYVGLFIGLGVFFLFCARIEDWRAAGLSLALISYTWLALVRAYGLLIRGEGNALMGQLLLSEVVLIVLALLGLYCWQRRQQ